MFFMDPPSGEHWTTKVFTTVLQGEGCDGCSLDYKSAYWELRGCCIFVVLPPFCQTAAPHFVEIQVCAVKASRGGCCVFTSTRCYYFSWWIDSAGHASANNIKLLVLFIIVTPYTAPALIWLPFESVNINMCNFRHITTKVAALSQGYLTETIKINRCHKILMFSEFKNSSSLLAAFILPLFFKYLLFERKKRLIASIDLPQLSIIKQTIKEFFQQSGFWSSIVREHLNDKTQRNSNSQRSANCQKKWSWIINVSIIISFS